MTGTGVLLSAPVVVDVPRPGLDESWRAGLQLIRNVTSADASPLIFTYGPLGLLDVPALPDPVQILAWTFLSLVSTLAMVWAMTDGFRRVVGGRSPLFLATLTVVVVAPSLTLSERATAASLAWSMQILGSQTQRSVWGPYLLAALAGTIMLVKVSEGALLVLLITMVVFSRPSRRLVAALLCCLCFLGVGCGWWLASGQTPGGVVPWTRGSVAMVLGYTQAMAFEGVNYFWVVATYAVAASIVARLAYLCLRSTERTRSLLAPLLVFVTILFVSRQGFVRHDEGHSAFAFTLLALLILVVPRRKAGGSPVDVALIAVAIALASPLTHLMNVQFGPWVSSTVFAVILGSLGLGVIARADRVTVRTRRHLVVGLVSLAALTVGVVQPWQLWMRSIQMVADPGARTTYVEQGAAADRASYDVSPHVLSSVKGRGVSVDPWEISAVFAYGLRWEPLPVFQNYAAFSPYLDDLNAAALRSDQNRVVMRLSPAKLLKPLDGRNPLWDSPRYNVDLLCRYRPMAIDPSWMSLQPSPTNRCGVPRLVSEVLLQPGQSAELPAHGDGEMVLATIVPGALPLTQVVSTVLLKDFSSLMVSLDSTLFRLPRAFAGSDLVVSVPDSAGWPEEFRGGHQPTTLSVSQECRVAFTVVPISA